MDYSKTILTSILTLTLFSSIFVSYFKKKFSSLFTFQMKSGDEARQLPCGHTFHRACVDDWLLKRRKCPLCNLNIVG